MKERTKRAAVNRKVAFTCIGLLAGSLLALATAKSMAAKPALVVEMLDAPPTFQPVQTTIKAGDTVEWKNAGAQLHHVTTDPAAALKKTDVANPPGAKPFDSGFLKPGESFRETFSVPGIYRYTCAVHEAKGMNGEVVVEK
ncbi:MAG: cupredoxin domain-containing protein [Deltaproteobacteria bacterium]|nr:cupredoxin domain-containing protein [Deltaproteobacteria bacterium]